ncbi:hypothetical protein LX16_0647 [Stackebrandtia albiflava]|uniref:Uncharacterized protein n=1 Tax=Stackebrandtia albiflava TaxID=406432 RepID=A0A562VAP8_9ACTN|nr:hypothetical protein LX16_0647 [Stackebrandtia albiflava]
MLRNLPPYLQLLAIAGPITAVIVRSWLRHRATIIRARIEYETTVAREKARSERLRYSLQDTDPRNRPQVLKAYRSGQPPTPPAPTEPDTTPR